MTIASWRPLASRACDSQARPDDRRSSRRLAKTTSMSRWLHAVATLTLGAVLWGALISAPRATATRVRRASVALEYGCPILPAEDPLNQEIADAPVSPNSAAYIASIGLSAHLHPDFGTNPSYGIPYTVVGPKQPKVPIKFTKYGSES